MIHYLIKTTEEYWLPDLESVLAFHKALQEDGELQGYQIASFAYTEKPIKEGKEIVDSYFITKVAKVFDDAKEPENAPMKDIGIQYNFVDRDSMTAHALDDMNLIEDETPFDNEVML